MVGEFHQCGYKFNRWYNMVWMEKHIGAHVENQSKVKTFDEVPTLQSQYEFEYRAANFGGTFGSSD
ncbi:MAG: hypothetical protein ACLTDS_01845 [Bianqueaceae bacterium]